MEYFIDIALFTLVVTLLPGAINKLSTFSLGASRIIAALLAAGLIIASHLYVIFGI
ncbi:hypothetical protein [Enterobacter quasiroggenkampii]|uniref:hypothetical protein n=1 Tax=Enterobacter quasiroggenkampii TaxID=2497436 RepID=UPI0021D166A3|nr:hypothetical protein [Enterobacter quasiroggenkampii]